MINEMWNVSKSFLHCGNKGSTKSFTCASGKINIHQKCCWPLSVTMPAKQIGKIKNLSFFFFRNNFYHFINIWCCCFFLLGVLNWSLFVCFVHFFSFDWLFFVLFSIVFFLNLVSFSLVLIVWSKTNLLWKML